jgi:hypothetical protein
MAMLVTSQVEVEKRRKSDRPDRPTSLRSVGMGTMPARCAWVCASFALLAAGAALVLPERAYVIVPPQNTDAGVARASGGAGSRGDHRAATTSRGVESQAHYAGHDHDMIARSVANLELGLAN